MIHAVMPTWACQYCTWQVLLSGTLLVHTIQVKKSHSPHPELLSRPLSLCHLQVSVTCVLTVSILLLLLLLLLLLINTSYPVIAPLMSCSFLGRACAIKASLCGSITRAVLGGHGWQRPSPSGHTAGAMPGRYPSGGLTKHPCF